MMFEYADEIERLADIKVTGIGGAGGNAIGRMISAGLSGVEFLAINTDLQALQDSPAHHAMQIGAQLTKGLGSGGDPSRGCAAAEEDREAIAAALAGADMVFVTAGMGGGTGTGAAPIVAEIARNQGALTVGIVTKPFMFEGAVRMQQALDGIERLRDAVDTLIIIPNQRLLEIVPPSTSMQEAFRIADNVLYDATRGIFEIISRHDHVNLDFADVRSVMKGMGEAMMGTGRAEGENRAVEAAKAAINSPLLEDIDITGSQAVLVNVLGREVGLQDTAAAMQYIQEAAGPDAHVIFGYGNDEEMGDTLQVTVIATGFDAARRRVAKPLVAAEVADPDVLLDEMVEATEGKGSSAKLVAAPAPVDGPLLKAENSVSEITTEVHEEVAEPVAEQVAEQAVETVAPVTISAEIPAEISTEISELATELPGELPVAEEARDLAITFAEPLNAESVATEPATVQVAPAATVAAPLAEQVVLPAPPAMPVIAERTVERTAEGMVEPTAEPMAQPMVQPMPEPAAAQTEAGFLKRMVAAADPQSSNAGQAAAGRFLTRVGVRPLGEVEVPAAVQAPPLVTRSVASGIGPDSPGDDISAPAYTRKYMD